MTPAPPPCRDGADWEVLGGQLAQSRTVPVFRAPCQNAMPLREVVFFAFLVRKTPYEERAAFPVLRPTTRLKKKTAEENVKMTERIPQEGEVEVIVGLPSTISGSNILK